MDTTQNTLNLVNGDSAHILKHLLLVVARQVAHDLANETALGRTSSSHLLIGKVDRNAADSTLEHQGIESRSTRQMILNNLLARPESLVCIRLYDHCNLR